VQQSAKLDETPSIFVQVNFNKTILDIWLKCLMVTGEINFVLVGVILQLIAIVLESFRLTMTQMLLQGNGIKLNPITTLYYVAPCCFAGLIPLFLAMEYSHLKDAKLHICPWHLMFNALAAFGTFYCQARSTGMLHHYSLD
jgi:hypothetical protein